MSHIMCSEEKISSYLDMIRSKKWDEDDILLILDGIIPKCDKTKINVDVSDKSGPAYFDSELELVHINPSELNLYVSGYTADMIIMNNDLSKCVHDLYAYNLLYALIHEVEHVYQYLVGMGYISSPYEVIHDLYNKLFVYKVTDISVIKDILLFRKMLYSKKIDFVLERNANIETCELLRRVCEYENNKDIFGSINREYLLYMKLGYLKKKYNGSFDESFSKLWRKDLFSCDINEDISTEERIRYGLPIDDESRKLLLRLE